MNPLDPTLGPLHVSHNQSRRCPSQVNGLRVAGGSMQDVGGAVRYAKDRDFVHMLVRRRVGKVCNEAQYVSPLTPRSGTGRPLPPPLPPLLSPSGNREVFVPCMLAPASEPGTGLHASFKRWYHPPPITHRMMAVRFEIPQKHYSHVTLMSDILDGVLPTMELTMAPVTLKSDGLVLDVDYKKGHMQSMFVVLHQWFGRDAATARHVCSYMHTPMSMVLYMYHKYDALRVDVAVRRPWVSATTSLRDLDARALRIQLQHEGLPKLAAEFFQCEVDGDDLEALRTRKGRLPVHFCPGTGSDEDRSHLVQLIAKWKVAGVTLGGQRASPLDSMCRQQLLVFAREVDSLLPPAVAASCHRSVLCPVALEREGLSAEAGFPFETVAWARREEMALLYARKVGDEATLIHPNELLAVDELLWECRSSPPQLPHRATKLCDARFPWVWPQPPQHSEDCYPIFGAPVGIALVFGNWEYKVCTSLPEKAILSDVKQMEALFHKLGFRPLIHINLTAEQIRIAVRDTLQEHYGSASSTLSCVAVYFSGHGSVGCFCGTDFQNFEGSELQGGFPESELTDMLNQAPGVKGMRRVSQWVHRGA